MKENINRYLHLTLGEFMDHMELEEKCPEDFGLENGDCLECGMDLNECRLCWSNAIKDISFKQELATFEKDNLMVLTHLAQIEKQFKDMDEERKNLKNNVLEQMEKHDISSFSNDVFSISYKKPSKVKTFDKDRFKEDYPELYEAYQKEVTRSSSIMFKLK